MHLPWLFLSLSMVFLHKRILFVRAPLSVLSTLLANCFIWHAISNRGRNSSACVWGVSKGPAISQVSICVTVGGYTLLFGLGHADNGRVGKAFCTTSKWAFSFYWYSPEIIKCKPKRIGLNPVPSTLYLVEIL